MNLLIFILNCINGYDVNISIREGKFDSLLIYYSYLIFILRRSIWSVVQFIFQKYSSTLKKFPIWVKHTSNGHLWYRERMLFIRLLSRGIIFLIMSFSQRRLNTTKTYFTRIKNFLQWEPSSLKSFSTGVRVNVKLKWNSLIHTLKLQYLKTRSHKQSSETNTINLSRLVSYWITKLLRTLFTVPYFGILSLFNTWESNPGLYFLVRKKE